MTEQKERVISSIRDEVHKQVETKIGAVLAKWSERVSRELVAQATVHADNAVTFRARDVPADLSAPTAAPFVVRHFRTQGVLTDHILVRYRVDTKIVTVDSDTIGSRAYRACASRARQLYEDNKSVLDPWLDKVYRDALFDVGVLKGVPSFGKIYDNLLQAHILDKKQGSATNVEMPALAGTVTDAAAWRELIRQYMGLSGLDIQQRLAQSLDRFWPEAPARKLWVRFHSLNQEALGKFYASVTDEFLTRAVANHDKLEVCMEDKRFPFAAGTYGRSVIEAELKHVHFLALSVASSTSWKIVMS